MKACGHGKGAVAADVAHAMRKHENAARLRRMKKGAGNRRRKTELFRVLWNLELKNYFVSVILFNCFASRHSAICSAMSRRVVNMSI